MIILLTIFQYFVQAVLDVFDKFLISKRKIEPLSYTFYTIVTGLFIVLAWPWFFAHIPAYYLMLSLLSGALFSLALFVYYLAVSESEISRVVIFVFGLVPLFDILIEAAIGKNVLTVHEGAAMFLLIPGALLIGYRDHKAWTRHVGLKLLAAFLMAGYFVLWNAASHGQPVMNNLMWNRIGGALVLVAPLVIPAYRKKIFSVKKVKQKKSTAIVFLFKQALGGANFIFLSVLLAVGNVVVVNSLQGFRYVFLFFAAFLLSHYHRHVLDEEIHHKVIKQKIIATALIFVGTVILFFK